MSAGRREVRVARALLDEMVAHCDADRPHEACGILAARDGAVTKVFRMTNTARSPLRYHFDSREQFAVYRTLEDRGWEIGAIYHSHTRTEAYPSPTDVRLAFEDVPYVIVSLASRPPDVRAFRIVKEERTDPTGEIEEVPVVVDG